MVAVFFPELLTWAPWHCCLHFRKLFKLLFLLFLFNFLRDLCFLKESKNCHLNTLNSHSWKLIQIPFQQSPVPLKTLSSKFPLKLWILFCFWLQSWAVYIATVAHLKYLSMQLLEAACHCVCLVGAQLRIS